MEGSLEIISTCSEINSTTHLVTEKGDHQSFESFIAKLFAMQKAQFFCPDTVPHGKQLLEFFKQFLNICLMFLF